MHFLILHYRRLVLAIAVGLSTTAMAQSKPTIRMVVTRAPRPIEVDGDLSEYTEAVATPVEYFHPDLKNRAAQFLYHWDDEAFYVGLRTLDQKTFSPLKPLWEGDAVEWYLDTRRSQDFLNNDWGGRGALHCFWTAMRENRLEPRFCLRPGYEDAIPQTGVKYAARRTPQGLTVEFKLPWINFPEFTPQVGEIIGIDAELSYSDGGPRSDRSFVFGSPLSVLQPANLARVKLVESFQSSDWKHAAAVMMPIRVDTPWGQRESAEVVGQIAMPVNHSSLIGRIDFQLTDLTGTVIGTFPAEEHEAFASPGNFARRKARWPLQRFAPGTYHVTAIVLDQSGHELARVAPRLVSVNMQQGY